MTSLPSLVQMEIVLLHKKRAMTTKKKEGSLRLMCYTHMTSILVFQSKELQTEPSFSLNDLRKYS
jgi:hypothetical protein